MPVLIATPFATNGTKNEIPETTGAQPQNATMDEGFPAITQQPISTGGIPPERADFNGILYALSDNISHINKGLAYSFDTAFATKIGGYPLHAELVMADGTRVVSTIANNMNNPDVDLTGWRKGVPASDVSDDSGLSQQQINTLTVRGFDTVADMIVSADLKQNFIIQTKGYHSVGDSGGARYVILSEATEYSIPLSNGLNAVFIDSFDIRKFGIRNSETLDQTEEIRRMIAYADDRVYEIDFHNFKIMTPKIEYYTNSRGTIFKGMGFYKVHKLKNLYVANDKTVQLYQGTSCILFMPKADGVGLFELENVTFDPYVADHVLVSMDEDGAMHGFSAKWYNGAEGGYPNNTTFISKYRFKFNNIEFITPAVSYNLAVAGIFSSQVTAKNMVGDYIGIYLVHHTNILDVQDVSGVYRDDLHASGRILVTNLIHEEAEIASRSIVRECQSAKNLTCIKYTTNAPHRSLMLHRIGTVRIKKIVLDNVPISAFYAGETLEDMLKLTIDHLVCKNTQLLNCLPTCNVTRFDITNCAQTYQYMLSRIHATDVNILGDLNLPSALIIESGVGEIQNLNIDSVRSSDNTYGVLRTTKVVKNVRIKKLYSTAPRVIECPFDTLLVDEWILDRTGNIENCFFCNKSAGSTSYASVLSAKFLGSISSNSNTAIFVAWNTLKIKYFSAGLIGKSAIGNRDYTEAKISVIIDAAYTSKTIAANAFSETSISMPAVKIGDRVSCVYIGDPLGTTFEASVVSNGSIKIVQRNPTGASVTTLAADVRLYINS